jgi:hypothetical protein
LAGRNQFLGLFSDAPKSFYEVFYGLAICGWGQAVRGFQVLNVDKTLDLSPTHINVEAHRIRIFIKAALAGKIGCHDFRWYTVDVIIVSHVIRLFGYGVAYLFA